MSGIKIKFSPEAVKRVRALDGDTITKKWQSFYSPWKDEEKDLEGPPILDKESVSAFKDVARFGPEELKDYINYVVQRYQTKEFLDNPANRKYYVLSVILQYQTLTWNALRKSYTTRDAFELLDATTQCNETIGEVTDTTECWLCGYAMNNYPYVNPNYREWSSVINSSNASNKPQCEHLLSVSSSLLLYGVPVSKEDAVTNRVRYSHNYGWAHGRCNAIKSSYLFADIFEPGSHRLYVTPVYNTSYVKTYLGILHSKIFEPGNLRPGTVVPPKADWIARRESDFIKPRFDTLLAEIAAMRAADTPLFTDFNLTSEQVKRCIFGIQKRFEDSVASLEGTRHTQDMDIVTAFKNQPKMIFKDTVCKPFNGSPGELIEIFKEIIAAGFIAERLGSQILAICSEAGGKRKKTRRIKKKNVKFSTSRRRLRTKNGNRKDSGSNRKK